MANSVDSDQTFCPWAVSSGSALFASLHLSRKFGALQHILCINSIIYTSTLSQNIKSILVSSCEFRQRECGLHVCQRFLVVGQITPHRLSGGSWCGGEHRARF